MSAMLLRPSAATSDIDAVLASMPQAVWRANQMASFRAPVVSTGFPSLDEELPNGGWPHSALVELLLQQFGIGEMQLLRPSLEHIGKRRSVMLIQPPNAPQNSSCFSWDLPTDRLIWIYPERSRDALWCAEETLRKGCCGAVVLWTSRCRADRLRRLQLRAQETDTVFWMIRPLIEADESSPAPLRLGIRPAKDGVEINFVKRRGPQTDSSLYLPLDTTPLTEFSLPPENDAYLDCSSSAAASAASVAAMLE